MSKVLNWAFLAAALTVSQTATAESRALTPAEARELAMAAVRDWHDKSEHLPGFELDTDHGLHPPGFLTFNAMWRGACETCGSSLGYFTININDADVFDPILFKEIKTPSVRRLQIKLRKKMNLDPETYRQYRKLDTTICWQLTNSPDGPLGCPRGLGDGAARAR
jgi:hypothetical protein